MKTVVKKHGMTPTAITALLCSLSVSGPAAAAPERDAAAAIRLPTGTHITPTAADGAVFEGLNPDLVTRPDYLADHAVDAVLSPDGNTLLILTSGYNRNNDPEGNRIADESNEYVFVYDVSGDKPQKTQVVQVPNTFNGIAWNPSGEEFYVSGGVDDNVHVYADNDGEWGEVAIIPLGHEAGEGRGVRPLAAGLSVDDTGTRLLVANFENDSVSLIDLASRTEIAEIDLRPGKLDPAQAGAPGGTYPMSVAFTSDRKAYVACQRDRELVVLSIDGADLDVRERIVLQGQPTKMTRDRRGSRLYVAADNSDTVVVVDTRRDDILEEIETLAPRAMLPSRKDLKGANPNNLVLSPDERTLFVTNGGTNSVAVVDLDRRNRHGRSRVVGLIPTGWYPQGVAVNKDGRRLFVVNGKNNAGPNRRGCRDTTSIESGSLDACRGANQYVWQLEKAGFLTLPMPDARSLARLTWQVAENSNFDAAFRQRRWERKMTSVRKRIKHVVYVIKENRTYDQVHGDLEKGNGDPALAILSPYSPNHQRLARQFITLDNFYDSGETSNTGWNWTTAARTTDFTEKTSPVNYAGRGLSYDWEGNNRNVSVGLETVAERQAANPGLGDDPDILAGTADVAAPDSPDGAAGAGYLWDSALRAGLTIRNYGVYVTNLGSSADMEDDVLAHPYANGVQQVVANKSALAPHTDVFFRGYDQTNADFYLYREWEREFDQFVARGELPNLSLVRFPHDHFGNFSTAKWGVNTVEAQMADNDLATALLIDKIAHSPFKDDTLVFVVEDDAQNGADHVDAHRSIAYVVGPYVKQGALISAHHTTVSMLRTIEEVLGIGAMGINDGLAEPMHEIFDLGQRRWTYEAVIPDILYTTGLELPNDKRAASQAGEELAQCAEQPQRSAQYWQRVMVGQDFRSEDRLDEARFNRALWAGLKGDHVPFPTLRHGKNMRQHRRALLRDHHASLPHCHVAKTTVAAR